MDRLLIQLKEYGADVDGAMNRLANDVELYKHCFAIVQQDKSMQLLGEALSANDYPKAYEYAHTLKGITGNMGLLPLCNASGYLAGALRSGNYDEVWPLYENAMKEFKKVEAIQL